MSIYRRAAKVDTAQADIVEAFEGRGIEVWYIREPCDLLLRVRCASHGIRCWQTMEIKTPSGKKNPKARRRKEQVRQNNFIDDTGTPVAISVEDAFRKLNALHRLPGIEIDCVLKPSAIAVRRY